MGCGSSKDFGNLQRGNWKDVKKNYTIKFLRSFVPGERTQEEQNHCRLRGGGEVEEDNGRDNSATAEKIKSKCSWVWPPYSTLHVTHKRNKLYRGK